MMMQSAWQLAFGFFDKLVVVEPAESYATSDAGLLPIREFDAQIGLTERFIAALNDPRHQPFVEHTFAEMARMRIYGILADYPDQHMTIIAGHVRWKAAKKLGLTSVPAIQLSLTSLPAAALASMSAWLSGKNYSDMVGIIQSPVRQCDNASDNHVTWTEVTRPARLQLAPGLLHGLRDTDRRRSRV
jgi:hypothetical protein